MDSSPVEKGLFVTPWSYTCTFAIIYTADTNIKVRDRCGVHIHAFSYNFILKVEQNTTTSDIL